MQSGPEQLKDWMRRRGFTQADAARYLGYNEPMVSRILNGGYSPGLKYAIHMERLTGIPVEAWSASELEESDEDAAVRVAGSSGSGGKRRVSK